MALTWLSNLFNGGGNTYKPPSYIGVGSGSAYQKVVNQPKQNAYASRMTAMARYYRNANANGVAQVRAIDNMQPAYNQNRNFLNTQQSNRATTNRYQAQADAYKLYLDNARRGYNAAGERLSTQAAYWQAINSYDLPTNQQPVGNQYGYGGGYGGYGGYGGGYGGDYGGASAATMPDWYSNFLGQMNWRI